MILSVGPEIDRSSLGSKRVQVGANVGLICVLAQGDPPVTFRWMKDSQPMISMTDVKIDSHDVSSSMVFSQTTKTHSGNYSCVASNPVGTSVVTTEILVNGNRQ